MSLQRILKELVDPIPEAVGAIMVDWEGEAVVEHCLGDPYEIRFFGAHQGIILSRLKEIHNSDRRGEIEEVVVTTTTSQLLIGCIDKDYALAMHVGRDCPLALAQRRFRNALVELKKEL